MGNAFSFSTNLRDEDAAIPSSICTVKSNIIMALNQGNFYPCIIVRNAETISEGYTVYFFHNGEETEIPSTNVIGNLKALLNCAISFTDENGVSCTGVVTATDTDNSTRQPMNFFITLRNNCKWVPLPHIFLTREQAMVFI